MKKITQTLIMVFLAVALSSTANGQEKMVTDTYYDVTGGNGYGLRFWSSNNYKIHMGNTANYKYGPVQDFSIKMNMNNDSDRGWTWGIVSKPPVAALNTQGTFQLAKDLKVMGNVGIGITAPGFKLHVVGRMKVGGTNAGMWIESGTTDWFVGRSGSNLRFYNNGDKVTILPNGNVGIGTSTPAVKLHVTDRMKLGGANAGMWIESGTTDWFVGRSGGNLRFYNNGDKVTILPNGNVGIGCTAPQSKLAVNGVIKATGMIVTSGPCSDFVFESDYNLMDLSELENFVTNNKHLPEVPSAQEFSEKGYSVGDMDDILLRKVEELTLYIIKQQKEFIKQQKEIEELKSKLK